MNRIKTDICIIGAGSGGLSIAAGAVQMGAKVVLIELKTLDHCAHSTVEQHDALGKDGLQVSG